MNIEDIKVGETYNVRVRVAQIEPNRFVCRPLNQDGTPSDFCPNYFNFAEAEAFSPISPENGIKNTETAPKYDPCRKFRKGDIVEPRKGREVYACEWEDCCFHKMAGKYEVQVDESEGHVSVIDKKTGIDCYVSAFALELVTPVEELELYSVSEATVQYLVKEDNKKVVAQFCKLYHPHAKEAAEAECDRLNAEYRKEVDNG